MKVVQLESGEVAVVMETDADKEWVLTIWGRASVASYGDTYSALRTFLPRNKYTSFATEEGYEEYWGVEQ
jgi:hypothetical protein